MPKVDAMLKYVRSLRNEEKRDYATRYAIWLQRNAEDNHVVPPHYHHLSYMAAQGVRMALDRIDQSEDC